jgi:hypothetical protein
VAGNFSPACHAAGMFDTETTARLLASILAVIGMVEWLIVCLVILLSIWAGPVFNPCTALFFAVFPAELVTSD